MYIFDLLFSGYCQRVGGASVHITHLYHALHPFFGRTQVLSVHTYIHFGILYILHLFAFQFEYISHLTVFMRPSLIK